MKTRLLMTLTTLFISLSAFSGDFGDCSLTCEDQANDACRQTGSVFDYACYGAAFWGCMAGCTSVKNTHNQLPSFASNILKYTKCSEEQSVPKCDAIGTRSEGWYQEGELVAWDFCKDKKIACENIGTKSEGWYIQ